MFDFPIQQSSVWTALYCFSFYVCLVLANYRFGLKYPFCRSVSNNKQKITVFFIGFFFITHCSSGDFFHMMEAVSYYSAIPGSFNYGEEIYHDIGLFVGKNYFLFRTIVWGGAFILFCFTAKRFEVPVYYAVIFLLSTHSIIFCYARATAAMAVYFWGLSFLCKPIKWKYVGYIIGILLIISSLQFHRSALIMIFMTLMILIPLRKWSILLVLIILPSTSVLFSEVLMEIAMSDGIDETTGTLIQHYSEREMQYGIAALLLKIIEIASFYIPCLLCTICIFSKNKIASVPISVFRMHKVCIGLILASITFLFMGSSYITFVYRVLFMSMIPLTIVVVKLYQSKLMPYSYYLWCLRLGIFYVSTRYMYDVYLEYINATAL